MIIDCHILAKIQKSCFCISTFQFRIYLGHIRDQEITFHIRHYTENEAINGLNYFQNRKWHAIIIRDKASMTQHRVLLNKSSVIKRLMSCGIERERIVYCLKINDFSSLNFQNTDHKLSKFISFGIFASHSPFS